MSFPLFNIGKRFWFTVDKPTELKEYIGRSIKVEGDDHKERVIEIEEIYGSLAHPSKFEVVAKGQHYLISMLDFYGQMLGERFSKDDIDAFDDIEYKVVPQQGSKIWRPSPKPFLRN